MKPVEILLRRRQERRGRMMKERNLRSIII
jgi:hypothetical protein